jgi:hypothetical protein
MLENEMGENLSITQKQNIALGRQMVKVMSLGSFTEVSSHEDEEQGTYLAS